MASDVRPLHAAGTGLGCTQLLQHGCHIVLAAVTKEGLPLHLFGKLPFYLVWLFKEIVMSNIATADYSGQG